MDNIFDKADKKLSEKFERMIKERLSIYLINSAKEQGVIDERMCDYILSCI